MLRYVITEAPISTNQGFKNLVLVPNLFLFFVRHQMLLTRELAEQQASGKTFLELSGARMKQTPTRKRQLS